MLSPPISSLFIQHLHCIRHLYRQILAAVLSGGDVVDMNGVYNSYQSLEKSLAFNQNLGDNGDPMGQITTFELGTIPNHVVLQTLRPR